MLSPVPEHSLVLPLVTCFLEARFLFVLRKAHAMLLRCPAALSPCSASLSTSVIVIGVCSLHRSFSQEHRELMIVT